MAIEIEGSHQHAKSGKLYTYKADYAVRSGDIEWHATVQHAQALAGQGHAGRAAPERDERPRPGERKAAAEREPEHRRGEHQAEVLGRSADPGGEVDMRRQQRNEQPEIDRPPQDAPGARGAP